MESFKRFVVRHRFGTSVVLSMLLCGTYAFLSAVADLPFPVILLTNFLFVLISFLFPNTCANKLMIKAVNKLNNDCDPYPLLQETEFLLQHTKPGALQQVYQINHSTALSMIGDFPKALDELTSVNIDQFPNTHPIGKYVYYNNLSSVYERLAQPELAVAWMEKAVQIYTNMKNSKLKRQYASLFAINEADRCCKNGEHAKALEILKRMRPTHKLQSIQLALRYGEVAIALGDTESAKAQYAFVIRNGNKLRYVEEARKILIELQKD